MGRAEPGLKMLIGLVVPKFGSNFCSQSPLFWDKNERTFHVKIDPGLKID